MVIWSSMTAAPWQPPGLRFLTEVISNILQTWMEVARHARYPVAKARETSRRTWATGVRSQAAATGGGTASALKTVAHTSAAFCCNVTAAWLPWNTRDGRSPGGGAHNPNTTYVARNSNSGTRKIRSVHVKGLKTLCLLKPSWIYFVVWFTACFDSENTPEML